MPKPKSKNNSTQINIIASIVVALIAFFGTVISALIAKIPVPTLSTSTLTPILLVVTETHSPSINLTPETNDVEITSTTGWQLTGINVNSGDKLIITVIDGSWTYEKGKTSYNNGEGNPSYICADLIESYKCVEPMPDFPTGGLIAQIGSQKFWVGSGTTIIVRQSGILQLRINDGDYGLYDNGGTLQIRIIVK